jgi:DNA modification methylase
MSCTFYNGDCLQVMKDLSANSIDCFICDLPFGCLETQPRSAESIKKYNRNSGLGGVSGGVSACAWDIKIDLEAFWKEVKRLAKNEHTPVLMFCTTKFGNELINSNPSWFRYDLVWDKQRGVSFLLANKMPMRSHEMVYVFSKAGTYYNRVDISGNFTAWKAHNQEEKVRTTPCGSGRNIAVANDGTHRCALSVIPMKKPTSRTDHPTEKPQDLYKWLLERYCPPGGTILDPTAGSFNSCFAAMNLDRHAIGIEKDSAFYEKACKKLDTVVE